jgi:hypothetical protein
LANIAVELDQALLQRGKNGKAGQPPVDYWLLELAGK